MESKLRTVGIQLKSRISVDFQLLSMFRHLAKSVFGIHSPKELSFLTQFRVGLSKLNFHKFKH